MKAGDAALHRIRSSEAQKRSGCTVLLDELAECIPDPLRQQETETQWLKELLENYLRTLKKEERYVFLRRYWYGYTIGELAAELSWREAKVNSLLYLTCVIVCEHEVFSYESHNSYVFSSYKYSHFL